MMETALCSEVRALDDDELDTVAGAVDGGAALRAVAAAYLVVSFGGSPYAWYAAAYKLA
jgi:hypothetical protein